MRFICKEENTGDKGRKDTRRGNEMRCAAWRREGDLSVDGRANPKHGAD